jgi:hypothetical protein
VSQADTIRAFLIAAIVAAATACVNQPALITQLLDARRLASELHVDFTKAAEASNRAVMADTDEASAAAADEARNARQIVDRNTTELRTLLEGLGYRADQQALDEFRSRYEEYRRLDDEILPLAVENTNLKAQRLSFGPAREAAEALRRSVDATVQSSPAKKDPAVEILAGKVRIAVLDIQAMQAPHIAESNDDPMTRMEEQMRASAAAARKALAELKAIVPPAAATHLAAAGAAFDRFMKINDELIVLSRRNSNVRSLALSLGRKRVVTADCEDRLRALEQALATHEFTATR